MIIKNRDIVVIGLQPWYTRIGSNCKNIALEFAKHNRVLYVNSPLDRRTVLTQKQDSDIAFHIRVSEGKTPSLSQISENLWNLYPASILESLNWLPSTVLFSFFNRINNKRYAADIRKAMDELGFTNVLLFNDNDIFRGYYMKEYLRPDKYIYYSRDNLVVMDYWKKHGAKLEPAHIVKADVAVANSLYLTERLQKYNPNSYYVGQGCDLSLFDPVAAYEKPPVLESLAGPVIGYVGNLTAMRLDPDILLHIAQARPEWQLVLVGPEDNVFTQSPLHELANVHFTGKKLLPELPAFIQHFDVCLNPQAVNEVTVGNYPLKIDEYLAMGKPVVATATATMELFRDHVFLAKDKEEYVILIEEALQHQEADISNSRIAFARSHTWENSVAAIYKAINGV